jgi:hypothetical protein
MGCLPLVRSSLKAGKKDVDGEIGLAGDEAENSEQERISKTRASNY